MENLGLILLGIAPGYLLIGMVLGIYLVIKTLAYYFSAGWRKKEMVKTVLIMMLVWPIIVWPFYKDED